LSYFYIFNWDSKRWHFVVDKEWDHFPTTEELAPEGLVTPDEYQILLNDFYRIADLRIRTSLKHLMVGLDAANFFVNIIPLDDIPLYINLDVYPSSSLIKWRLYIGK
jgi:hypothetical protein